MQVVASTTSWECSEPHVLELSLSRWNHGSSSCLNECAAVQRQECVLCSCFMLRRCAAVASDKRADFCASCVRRGGSIDVRRVVRGDRGCHFVRAVLHWQNKN